MISPREASIPCATAFAFPCNFPTPGSARTQRIEGSVSANRATISPVASVERSSTTITSRSSRGYSSALIDARHAPIFSSSFLAAMITETDGRYDRS